MTIPGFTAGTSVYKSSRHYHIAADTASSNQVVPQQRCPPPGLCEKASRICRRGDEAPFCDILADCFDCRVECTPSCDPPKRNPALGPCLWERCVDQGCNESWRPAPGCTRCVAPGVRECRDASGNCSTTTEGCSVTCTPTTRCFQDPATTNPRCQICYRDNCDGTASVRHTC